MIIWRNTVCKQNCVLTFTCCGKINYKSDRNFQPHTSTTSTDSWAFQYLPNCLQLTHKADAFELFRVEWPIWGYLDSCWGKIERSPGLKLLWLVHIILPLTVYYLWHSVMRQLLNITSPIWPLSSFCLFPFFSYTNHFTQRKSMGCKQFHRKHPWQFY